MQAEDHDHDHGKEGDHQSVHWPRVSECELQDSWDAGLVDATDPVDAIGELVGIHEGDRHDLSKAEGHDRKVVTAKAKRRCAEQNAEDCTNYPTGKQHWPERQVNARKWRGNEGIGVTAEGEEGGVAEVEQARKADHYVQPHCQHRIDCSGAKRVHPGIR